MNRNTKERMKRESGKNYGSAWIWLGCVAGLAGILSGCGSATKASAESASAEVTVGVTKVTRQTLSRQLTVSSELVPFQEIDVYAKESGFVKQLFVDYGTRVKQGQLMAVLEIPELEAQIKEDEAMIQNSKQQVQHATEEISRSEAQHKVLHLEYDRLNTVSKSKPGLVAQQEVDDLQGRDLASEAQVEAAKATLEGMQSQMAAAKAKKDHDQVLFDYARITAPFTGVVTQRYANLGTLMQAGTSNANALPLVRLSEDDLFRLVIPVPESSVHYIRIGDVVNVLVSSLNRTFPGKVSRFSVDVKEDTRTMHTEVDVANPQRVLVPGLYAEATLTLEHRENVLALPLEAVNRTASGAVVLVVDSSGKLEERKVELGLQTAQASEILSGVNEGDEVVVSDRSALKPGEQVKAHPVQLLEDQSTQGQASE